MKAKRLCTILVFNEVEGGGEVNLLFWNLAKNDNCKLLEELITEKSVDIAIVSEYQKTDLSETVKTLGPSYLLHNGFGGCEKITLIAKKDILILIVREQARYTIYYCKTENTAYLIIGTHLPSNPNADADDRKVVIRDLIGDIREAEEKYKCDNTIVTGDFNANPFDSEIIGKDSFNAVLYKEVIRHAEYVNVGSHKYRRFYNPMVNAISEDTGNYGSFYYSNGINSLYWLCFDQVIVRRPLIDKIEDVGYCKSIRTQKLIADFCPKKEISDHLPLFFRLTEGV